MSTRGACCDDPRPRPAGVGRVVCDNCKREVKAKKKDAPSAKIRSTMPPEFHQALNNLRREFNEKIERLKAQYLKQ